MRGHPDKEWVESVVTLVSNIGGDMGHRGDPDHFVAKYHALSDDQVIAAKATIQERLRNKWIIGPFNLSDDIIADVSPVISPWFLVPKGTSTSDNPKFREIQDLTKSGVNDGISQDSHRTEYGSLEDALTIIRVLGRNAWMFVIDIAHAYRNLKLRQQDWRLTAFRVLNLIFFDTRLPMGSRSSPFLWMEFIRAFKWILKTNHGIVNVVDYMDDFMGAAASYDEARENMNVFLALARQLNVPIAPDKIQMAQEVEFLGIVINTVQWTISFSAKKRDKLLSLVNKWKSAESISNKELQSMIGKFLHASIVYFGGGTFTRPLIHKLKHVRNANRIQMAKYPEIALSLKWWDLALRTRNDRPITRTIPDARYQLWSDASYTKGLGAFYNDTWFAIRWNTWNPWKYLPDASPEMHINILELLAVVLSCAIWGGEWNTSHVLIHCDNSSVCDVVTAKRSKDEVMNHLLMLLHYIQIRYGFDLSIAYINTKDNIDADDISRFQFVRFFKRNPRASRTGLTVPWSALPEFQLNTKFLNLPTIDQKSITTDPQGHS
jgi:hypothetical protein